MRVGVADRDHDFEVDALHLAREVVELLTGRRA